MKRRHFILILSLALGGCAGHSNTPVIDKSPYRKTPPTRTVRKGDSLYSISWEFGLDYKTIAKWNGIRSPYIIRIGQTLRLRPPSGGSSVAVKKPAKTPPKPGVQARSQPRSQPSSQSVAKPQQPISGWIWPVRGKLIGRYSRQNGVNGIQISNQAGTAIKATQGGEVVYSGQGLRGYGRLVIVKHSSIYLSAYAHNKKILVAEGQQVKKGQKIAQMGNSGTDRTMLHFEIRKNGKPVDPLRYLPKI